MKKVLLTICLFMPLTVLAETQLGFIGAKSQSVYKATDSKSVSLPNVSYEGENFFLRLPEIGYRFFPRRSFQNVAVGLTYEISKFDPDDSHDANIRKLDDRDDSVMASWRSHPIE
ncbi:MipA/OmpV family protein [Marinomonas sp.]|uniref:MipA/OmpV family protein n=1 Tax=Marinomonas sp. TaxID=1904862 RepID=UPI003BAA04E0